MEGWRDRLRSVFTATLYLGFALSFYLASACVWPIYPQIDRADFELFAEYGPPTPASPAYFNLLQSDLEQNLNDQGYERITTPWWHRCIKNLQNPTSPFFTMWKKNHNHTELFIFFQAAPPWAVAAHGARGLDVRYSYLRWKRLQDPDSRNSYPTEAYDLWHELEPWWKERQVNHPRPSKWDYRGSAASSS